MGWIDELVRKVEHMQDAIAYAERIGTLNKPDRSKQYPIATEKQIVDAVNLALTKTRRNEENLKAKADAKEVAKLIESRVWHRIVVIVAAAEFTLIVMLLEKFAK